MLPLVFCTKQSIGSTAGRIAVLTVGEKKPEIKASKLVHEKDGNFYREYEGKKKGVLGVQGAYAAS